jgi:cytochrome P450
MLLQDNWKEVTGVLAMIGVFFLCMLYLGLQSKFGAVRDEGDDPFQNGLDLAFLARVLFQGLSIDSFIRNMCRRTRGRIFVGFKRYLFFGRTYVFLGHPSLVKQVFGPHRSKLYQKVTGQIGNDSGRRNMLFAGDGPGWSNVKRELCPYFFRADFAVEDDIMNRIVQKHLQRVSNYHHGETELLELCLLIVVDLLSNVLFKYEIPIEELQMLTLALTKYVAPGGSANKRTFPEGLTALQ